LDCLGDYVVFKLHTTFYVLAMVGHLKNVSPTFAQMPDRSTNVEFTTVSPTIANTMLWAGLLVIVVSVRLLAISVFV
jgi:hypothetical protein